MGGLLSDIGSVCNTFSSVDKAKGFGSDILTNVGQSLGILDKKMNYDMAIDMIQNSVAGDNHDLRGISQVFRDKKYFFAYDQNYKCYNDDFYFNSQNGKEFKNTIQDIILYQYQPYKQTDLGTQLRKLEKKYGDLRDSKNREDFKKTALSQVKGLFTKGAFTRNDYIDKISANPKEFYDTRSSF